MSEAQEPSNHDHHPTPLSGLTTREREVLSLVVAGCTAREMGTLLGISVHTVDTHLRRLRVKSGARCRADLVRLALAPDAQFPAGRVR